MSFDKESILLDNILILKSSLLFKNLPLNVITSIANHSILKSFKEGEVILQYGKIAPGIYLIINGSIEAALYDVNKAKVVHHLYGPEDLIGVHSTITRGLILSEAKAVTRVDALYITAKNYRFLLNKYKEVSDGTIAELNLKIRELRTFIIDQV